MDYLMEESRLLIKKNLACINSPLPRSPKNLVYHLPNSVTVIRNTGKTFFQAFEMVASVHFIYLTALICTCIYNNLKYTCRGCVSYCLSYKKL